jgi:phosphatidate cytidylyltransferase
MTLFSPNTMIRLASSLALMPLVIFLIIAGGWWFGIFVALAFGLAYGEWFSLCKATRRTVPYLIIGTLYFSISFSEFVYLRNFIENGVYLTLLCLFMVWASDTGGYIFGKKIGGPLMTPTISPKKTWSGMVGAVTGSAIIFTLGLLFAPHLNFIISNTIHVNPIQLPLIIFAGAVMGYVGQVGDLLISSLKRRAQAKDSGHLIPGHGGILDRIDSLLLVIPVFVIVARYAVNS